MMAYCVCVLNLEAGHEMFGTSPKNTEIYEHGENTYTPAHNYLKSRLLQARNTKDSKEYPHRTFSLHIPNIAQITSVCRAVALSVFQPARAGIPVTRQLNRQYSSHNENNQIQGKRQMRTK